ncbi:universal stress protein [Haloarchaeobius sp. TZWWS8]|uniref:universal stress protein n=1 Tax=Haloarchaeobius sp. TZWWS8 TaxID=3446121 RepID=UPI003EBBC95F
MTVVAAIDDSERAQDVAVEAAKLAAAFDDELHCLHVFDRSRLVDVLEVTMYEEKLTENYEVQQEAERIVSAATAHIDYPVEIAVRVGDPGENITEYADDVDARYLVIGGRKRSPAGKVLFGSVTQKVMLNVDQPVVNASGSR